MSSKPYRAARGYRGAGTRRPSNRRGPPRERCMDAGPSDPDIMRGLKEIELETIPVPLSVQDDPNIRITDTIYLGSYNWTARSIPTIIVPGMPGRWYDREPFQVGRDTGICIIDQNTHRFSESPLLPLLVSVDANEDADTFDWSAVDFVANRNALRKVLRWTAEDTRDFRIDLQLAGKRTVLMTRWDKKTTEPFVGYTYGFNYFNQSTKQHHPESTSHNRVINYVGRLYLSGDVTDMAKNMDGLNMVVRYTVDGYVPSSSDDIDDIADALASLDVSSVVGKSKAMPVKGTLLHVIPFGERVPQESIIEIATISEAREHLLDWDEKMPQLFLSQTEHFYLGLHDRGFFEQVRKHKFDAASSSEKMRGNMKRLRRALGIIQEIVTKYGQRGRLSLVCVNGTLKVYERMSRDSTFLPDEYMQRFGI